MRTRAHALRTLPPQRLRLARKLRSAATVAGIVSLARSDPRVATTSAEFDRDPYLLNTPGGTVDLRSELRSHRRDDLITHQTNVTPDFTAAAPMWDRFMREIFDDDQSVIDYVKAGFGYGLTGLTHLHLLFFFWGTGRDGKNTLVELV